MQLINEIIINDFVICDIIERDIKRASDTHW